MAHPTNEERVDAEEQRLGRRLPSQLRDRLIEENGGEVESDEPFNDHWELYGVADLRSDKKGRSWMADGLADVTEREVESWGEAWQMPDDVVVIAANGQGTCCFFSQMTPTGSATTRPANSSQLASACAQAKAAS